MWELNLVLCAHTHCAVLCVCACLWCPRTKEMPLCIWTEKKKKNKARRAIVSLRHCVYSQLVIFLECVARRSVRMCTFVTQFSRNVRFSNGQMPRFLIQNNKCILFRIASSVCGHCKIAFYSITSVDHVTAMKWLCNRYIVLHTTFAHGFQSNFKWDFFRWLTLRQYIASISIRNRNQNRIDFFLILACSAACALSTHRQLRWSEIFSLVHCVNYREAVDFN